MKWWYSEFKKRSSGPWLSILDNCGDQDPLISIPDVRIEHLPANTTSTYQLVDLGLIFHAWIRFFSLLLKTTCHIVENKQTEDLDLEETTGRGRWGLWDGQIPHVADAIYLFDEAWKRSSNVSVIKCWAK
eukprot:IDg23769t1